MSLTFNEKSHRYRLDDKPVKSVTTILSGGIPKPALLHWAANEAAGAATAWLRCLKEIEDEADLAWNITGTDPDAMYEEWRKEPFKQRNEAAVRGTAVHDLAEHVVKGEAVDVPVELAPYVEGYVDFLDEWEIEPLFTENLVASRKHWYSGKFDLIATSPYLNKGEPVMIDLKTSRSVHAETALQCAAYSLADFMQDGDIERPLPRIAATYVAHVTSEGTKLYELSPNRREMRARFQEFLSAKVTASRWNPKELKEKTK